jgi:(p)ppGpp synthase/HD superfamily hydrolase
MTIITSNYGKALAWADELHRGQRRKGKEKVPYISHLIAVSALVWEDEGDEEQAIAALLHDAIEDAGVEQESIAEKFGERVARIVADCTDTTGAVPPYAKKEPWIVRKTRYVEHLKTVGLDSLLVTAADKAHNARDQVLDARRDAASWTRFNAGLDGTAWYLLRIHQTLSHRLPNKRSTEMLGEAVKEILDSDAYRRLTPDSIAASVWAAGYVERQQ